MNQIKKLIYHNIIPLIGRILLKKNKFINVIYYHDIVDGKGHTYMRTNKDVFQKQMEFLSSIGIRTYTFTDLDLNNRNESFDNKSILITFDDGWKSNYAIFPFMKKLGLKYNIFLEVGKIGVDPDYLSWDQIREMFASGLVGFGAHTYSHPDMATINNYSYNNEISRANNIIKQELGVLPNDFCFPFGSYSVESLSQIVKSKVYRRVYTSNMNFSYLQDEVIVMGRTAISNDDSEHVFKAKAKGYYNIFKSLMKLCHLN